MKTFQEFITEVEAYSNIRSLAPYKVMPPLKTKDGKPNPAPQRFLINPKTGLGPTAQIVPMKTTVLGPDLKSLPHMNLQGQGQKLMSVIRQKNYMDDTGRRPPKIP